MSEATNTKIKCYMILLSDAEDLNNFLTDRFLCLSQASNKLNEALGYFIYIFKFKDGYRLLDSPFLPLLILSSKMLGTTMSFFMFY